MGLEVWSVPDLGPISLSWFGSGVGTGVSPPWWTAGCTGHWAMDGRKKQS